MMGVLHHHASRRAVGLFFLFRCGDLDLDLDLRWGERAMGMHGRGGGGMQADFYQLASFFWD